MGLTGKRQLLRPVNLLGLFHTRQGRQILHRVHSDSIAREFPANFIQPTVQNSFAVIDQQDALAKFLHHVHLVGT